MSTPSDSSPGRILGIGGVFFKSAQQKQLSDWYREKMGIDHDQFGAMFKWRSIEEPSQERLTIWSIFPSSSDYFAPSQAFMINYIVDDLDALLEKLRQAGVQIDPKRDDFDYGRFAWIYDPDGNKIELWQPVAASTP
jgi:predicted enzyme related to lactoylglutathione lyase